MSLRDKSTVCQIVDMVAKIIENSPKANYTLGDILLLVDIVYREGPIGRRSLIKKLGLGERSLRNLLGKLERHGIIKRDPIAGVMLSTHVEDVLSEKGLGVNLSRLTEEEYCVGIAYHKNHISLSETLKLRDCIIQGFCSKPLIMLVDLSKTPISISIPGLERGSAYFSYYESKLYKEKLLEKLGIKAKYVLLALFSAKSFSTVKNCLGILASCYCDLIS